MKSTEFMIGDWVCVPVLNRKNCKVVLVANTHVAVETDSTYIPMIYNVEPIPLTADILKANGFNYTEQKEEGLVWERFTIYDNLGDLEVDLISQKNCPNYGVDIGGYYGFYQSNGDEFHYVHELQHALRLCGIDKEIIMPNTQES